MYIYGTSVLHPHTLPRLPHSPLVLWHAERQGRQRLFLVSVLHQLSGVSQQGRRTRGSYAFLQLRDGHFTTFLSQRGAGRGRLLGGDGGRVVCEGGEGVRAGVGSGGGDGGDV